MILQNCFPDFITVDGAESGIGATLFSDAVGMPIEPALIFVNKTLISLNIRDKIRVICSGKIISGYPYLEQSQREQIRNSVRVLCFIRLHSEIEMQ
jgi:hypothetical protein